MRRMPSRCDILGVAGAPSAEAGVWFKIHSDAFTGRMTVACDAASLITCVTTCAAEGRGGHQMRYHYAG